MTYTVLSAHYANQGHTAALLQTQEAGAVLASQADTPELWALVPQDCAPYAAPFDAGAAFKRLRDLRAPYLNALAGMLSDAIVDGDTAAQAEIRAARLALQTIPAQSDLQAGQVSDDDTFDARVMAHIITVRASATPAVAKAFRDLT